MNLPRLVAVFSILILTSVPAVADPPITSVAFAPESDSVVACSQNGLKVYQWPSLELKETHSTSPSDGKVLVGGSDGQLRVVNPRQK